MSKPKFKFSIKAADRLAQTLEDHGWNVFNEDEYGCPKCRHGIDAPKLYLFCPWCGYGFQEGEPLVDAKRREATVIFIAECVQSAIEDSSK